jgi:SAM-dependent methyltransferase
MVNLEIHNINDMQDMICLCCNSNDLVKSDLHSDRRKGLKGYWSLYKCNNCGMVAIYPSPSETELSEYYSVYSSNKEVTFSLGTGSRYPILRQLFHWISGVIDPRDFIKPGANSKMLDYGCGEAGCLFAFHSRGINISGAEISLKIVNTCLNAGLDVRQVTNPDQIPFENNIFDIVYLMQVFEHLRNPHIFLEELQRVLKPRGTLFIAIPNSKSVWRKIFGKNWVSGWFVPFHLFHYDKQSISKLARQHGFDVLKSWSRTPESWFRLNLKAFLYPKERRLDDLESIVDSNLVRIPLMVLLRIMELFIRQHDCLVIELVKQG